MAFISNKRGASAFFLLSMFIVFFLLGLALTPVLVEVIGESTDGEIRYPNGSVKFTTELNCSNESISDQNRAVCTSIDIQSFLFFATIMGLAGIFIANIAG